MKKDFVSKLFSGKSIKKAISLVICLAICLMAVPFGALASTEVENKPIKVLAIGNSYSNNTTEYVSRIAESMGLDITAASLYFPGCALWRHVHFYENYRDLGHDGYYESAYDQHYEDLYVNGAAVGGYASIQEAIAYTDWDYITIQQMPDWCDDIDSYWTEENPYITKLYGYVLDELEKNNNNKCEILIHQGWSFSHAMSIDNAYEYYPRDYENTRDFFAAIESTVNQAAEIVKTQCGLDAAPDLVLSGKAVQLAKDEFGFGDTYGASDSLYADNVSHLSSLGKYLAACVWIETFAAKANLSVTDVRTTDYFPIGQGITADKAAALRSCAHEAVTGEADSIYEEDWRAVPCGTGLEVTNYFGEVPEDGKLVIPASLDGKKVYSVSDNAFKYLEGIKSVTIQPTIWDGTEVPCTKGSGTEADPYLIEIPEQLAYLVKNGGGSYYKLIKDIYLNDVSKIDWSTGEVEEGYEVKSWYSSADITDANAFRATLDGAGHVIYGLYKDTAENTATALFPKTSQNTSEAIRNLGIESSYLVAGWYSAAFVGDTVASSATGTLTIENCYVGADVTIKAADAAAFYSKGGSNYIIDKCYTLATIVGTEHYGIVACVYGSSKIVSNTYAVGTRVTTFGEATLTNVCVTEGGGGLGYGLLTAENMQGLDALTNESKMARLAECDAFVATESYPILKIFASEATEPETPPVEDEIKIWDGTVAEGFAEGSGTEADPYLISTAEELAYLVKNGGSNYYKLTNDIYLNNVDKVNWATGAVEEGYDVKSWYTSADVNIFWGDFDGDGHVIYGLYKDTAENTATALFPLIQQNTSEAIRNLGIESSYLVAGWYSAAFVGDTVASSATGTLTIENCYVGADVTIKAADAAAFYSKGGSNYVIDKCYTLATIVGTEHYGIVACVYGSSKIVRNTYAVGTRVTTFGEAALENVCVTEGGGGSGYGLLTAENMQGLDALTSESKMVRLAACDAFVATESYPILKIFASEATEPETPPVEDEIKIWDGTVAEGFAEGSGTEADPYLISTAEELAYLVKNGCWDKYYKLTKDIYLNDVEKINWSTGVAEEGYNINSWFTSEEVGNFVGAIDGDGHIVYGLYVNTADEASVALFPMVHDGASSTIKNLGIEAAYLSCGSYAAAFVGAAFASHGGGTLTMENCYAGADVTVIGTHATAFFAKGGIQFDINKCYSVASLSGSEGEGMVGDVYGSSKLISNSYIAKYGVSSKSGANVICLNVYCANIRGSVSGAHQLTDENMKGAGVLTNAVKMQGLAECDAFIATASYPVLKAFPYVPAEYKITFNANGGTVSPEFVEGIEGEVIEFPAPVKAGYVFKAWYKDADCTILAGNVMPAEDVTYYAKWYVEFDADNDGAVTSGDLVALKKALLDNDFAENADFSVDGADCNSDSAINIIDLIVMQKVLADAYTTNVPAGYRLVWSDEFSGTDYNSDVWADYGTVEDDTIASSDNINVANGALNMSLTYDSENQKYVCARSVSGGAAMNFKRGYVELRAKVPYLGQGEWPAVWMLPTTASLSKDIVGSVQPDYDVEIDLVENMSTKNGGYSQLHFWGFGGTESIQGVMDNGYYFFPDDQSAADWHTYGLLWTEDKVEFYLDDNRYCTYNIPENMRDSFDVYMSLILSQRHYPSNGEETFFTENPNGSIDMSIDYIRIFQNPQTDSILVK